MIGHILSASCLELFISFFNHLYSVVVLQHSVVAQRKAFQLEFRLLASGCFARRITLVFYTNLKLLFADSAFTQPTLGFNTDSTQQIPRDSREATLTPLVICDCLRSEHWHVRDICE